MLGLKTQETKKFEKFIELIQNEAAKKEKVFFLDAGDGRDFETNDVEGCEMWILDNPKLSLVWRMRNNPLGINWEISTPELPSL